MKTILIVLAIIFTHFATQAQHILIKSDCSQNITTTGDIFLDPAGAGGTILLKDVTLTCNKLHLGANAAIINIEGSVKIICNNIVMDGAGIGNIIIGKGALVKSELLINIKSISFPTRRKMEINNGVKIQIDKGEAEE